MQLLRFLPFFYISQSVFNRFGWKLYWNSEKNQVYNTTGLDRSQPVFIGPKTAVFCGLLQLQSFLVHLFSGLFRSWSGPVAVFLKSRNQTFKHYRHGPIAWRAAEISNGWYPPDDLVVEQCVWAGDSSHMAAIWIIRPSTLDRIVVTVMLMRLRSLWPLVHCFWGISQL